MIPFDSAQARPGTILRGIDPASLLAGRDELELTRLETQRKLIVASIKRFSLIKVNLSGVIIKEHSRLLKLAQKWKSLLRIFRFNQALGHSPNCRSLTDDAMQSCPQHIAEPLLEILQTGLLAIRAAGLPTEATFARFMQIAFTIFRISSKTTRNRFCCFIGRPNGLH